MNESQIDEVFNILKNNCYNLYYNENTSDDEGFCETVFDGYFCWPFTKAGELAIQPCSNNLLKSIKKGFASRQCTENGTWLIPKKPNTTMVKSNRMRLHCARNKLHINLFVSFIMRSFMSILKDGLFVKGTTLVYETQYIDGEPKFIKDINYSWVCKAIISVRWYFVLSNFMLMLMEGMYLHNLMFLNLFSDNHGITIYCLLGWGTFLGLPVLFMVPWIIMRILYEDVLCWTQKDDTLISLFIDLPIGITVVINFLLFLIIVRVLIRKLYNASIQQRRIKYRKLLKATLILIPLFGVPYSFSLLMSLYIKKSQILEVIWLFFDQTFTAFQGLFAALVYCLLNSEVQIEIKRKYSSIKDRTDKEFRRSRTISNTQQFFLQNNDDSPENLQCLANGKGNPEEIILTKERQCHF
ncbi:hypothetical protein NQ314_021211 [Rhamnusium bicolor]|uniref:Uncharacterized protein n=1 Tax=Rhamnusium bicolor TaxID=1586634 RepID=A0AAV8WIY1_9CUCU|nr:hypothetical protein NQ314_021211 [Rhamnusium bicolor]